MPPRLGIPKMRYATTLLSSTQEGATVTLHTDATPIRLLAVTPEILRIRAGFTDDGAFREASYSLVTTAWRDELDDYMGAKRTRLEPSPLSLENDPDSPTVTVRGERLRIEIDREPFRLRVYDSDGSLLHADLIDRGYRLDRNQRRIHTSEIAAGDHFYGFGEKTGEFNKAKSFMTMRAQDCLGYDAERADSLYKHIPFYIKANEVSGAAVGYFYHNTFACDFDMGRSHSNYWPAHSTYRTDGGDIDLFLIAGPSVREVVTRYTLLTGTSAVLPAAALGYLGSSMYYPELPKDADDAILNFYDHARRENIPMDGFQLSSGYCQQETDEGLKRCVLTWNTERFKDPAAFFAESKRRGIVVSPNVKPGVLNVHPRMPELIEDGVFVRASESDEPAPARWWGGPGHLVDFTNPKARERWEKDLTENMLDFGTASIWNDNCEYDSIVDEDARCDFDGYGAPLAEARSIMANIMCSLTADAIGKAHPNARPFIVCRAGYAGIQRFAQTWSGDNHTCWETLKGNIATMLGMSLSGVANQGGDIGGFHGPAPEGELFVRWVQNGIFQPRFSIHSVNSDNTVTEPWMYPSLTPLVREAIQLRYRLFPYLYSLMERAHRTGLPIAEPLVSAFQHDPAVWDESVNYMLGDSLFIANVVDKGADTKTVTFPANETFYDLATRERYEGGRSYDIPVTLASIPTFVREGGIVPLASEDHMSVSTETVDALTLVTAPGRDGQFTLYEDDGVSMDYTRGRYSSTTVTMTAGDRAVYTFTHEGDLDTRITTLELQAISHGQAPFWVSIDGEQIPHALHPSDFDSQATVWLYDLETSTVRIKTPWDSSEHTIVVSFEQFDMIGM